MLLKQRESFCLTFSMADHCCNPSSKDFPLSWTRRAKSSKSCTALSALHLCDIMLQDGGLHPLRAPQPFHNPRILIPYIALNHTFHGLDLIQPMVESHYLPDELGSLGHERVMD